MASIFWNSEIISGKHKIHQKKKEANELRDVQRQQYLSYL